MINAMRWACCVVVLAATPMPAQSADGEPLRVRLKADIRSTEPGVNRDSNSDMVVNHIVEGLVAYREDTSVGPMLAESVTASEDGLAYTFKLRGGVKFHNGADLTSADVKFAWDHYLKEATKWRCLKDFTGRVTTITAIEAPDPATVVFRLKKPANLFLASMARVDCGQSGIWHRSSLNEDGSWKSPVGTGPYKLVEWRKGQFVDLEKFKDYAARSGDPDGLTGGKAGGPQLVRISVVPDPSAAKAALISGAIDLLPDVDEKDVTELRGKPGMTVTVSPTLGSVGILLQTKSGPFADVRLRKALALSLDYPEIVKTLAGDDIPYNPSPIPTSSGFYGETQKHGYKRDLAAAKKLLAEAGYKGEPIKLLTNKRYSSMYETAVLVQAMATEAGLNLQFEVIDWATQLDHYLKGTYAAMAFAYSARYDPTLSFDMFSGPKDKQARKVWDNPDMLKLIAATGATTDKAKRQALFDKLHTQMIEDAPAIWLYNNAAITASGPRIAAFKSWVTEQPRLWAVTLK